MALFPRWTNTVARLAFAAALGVPTLAIAGLVIAARAPLGMHRGVDVAQPMPFDHRLHAGTQGIDCLYCHTTARSSPVASVPSVGSCMGCHAQVWNTSPQLEPLRRASSSQSGVAWVKVHALSPSIRFDHAAHAMGCATCHGNVEQMPRVRALAPLTMRWCVDCHLKARARNECSTCHR